MFYKYISGILIYHLGYQCAFCILGFIRLPLTDIYLMYPVKMLIILNYIVDYLNLLGN